jgi:Skp family chaperone for outer membrane proteins
MEDNYNSPDISSVITELQVLNQSINTENQKIDKFLEYLVARDQEAVEKEEAEQVEADSEKVNKELETKQQEEKEQQKAQQEQETTETYTELLSQINDGIQLTNQLLTVDVLIFGIVIGLLLIKIFIDRMVK